MSQVAIGSKTFVAGEAIPAYRRVKLDTTAGQVLLAGADEVEIGVSEGAAASGAQVAVALKGARTFKIAASAAVTVNTSIYRTASGKIDDAGAGSGSVAMGLSLEAALADGDIIECLLETDLV